MKEKYIKLGIGAVAINAAAIFFLAFSQRFEIESLRNGIVRLDKLTGTVSICRGSSSPGELGC